MKIAIAGKGGAGKTSITKVLGEKFRDSGHKVLLVDADPDGNLPHMFGLRDELLQPITNMKELIKERTGVDLEDPDPSYFVFNPRVDDIPSKYTVDIDGIKLLIMGTVNTGGAGCACSINSFVRQLIRHLIMETEEVVILDMEAGIEHLGRGTARNVNTMCIVTEPNSTGLTTVRRIVKLSDDLGIPDKIVIGNKIRDDNDKLFLKDAPGQTELFYVPFSQKILEMSRIPGLNVDLEPGVKAGFETIIKRLTSKGNTHDRLQ